MGDGRLFALRAVGNIGSEIERAIKWGGRGDTEHRMKALERSMIFST